MKKSQSNYIKCSHKLNNTVMQNLVITWNFPSTEYKDYISPMNHLKKNTKYELRETNEDYPIKLVSPISGIFLSI